MFGIGDAINFGTSFVSDIFGGDDDDLLGFGADLLGGLLVGGGAAYGAHLDAKTAMAIARENREAVAENYRTAPYYNHPAATDEASADNNAPVNPQAGVQTAPQAVTPPPANGMAAAGTAGRGGLAGPRKGKRYVRNPANGALMRAAA